MGHPGANLESFSEGEKMFFISILPKLTKTRNIGSYDTFLNKIKGVQAPALPTTQELFLLES